MSYRKLWLALRSKKQMELIASQDKGDFLTIHIIQSLLAEMEKLESTIDSLPQAQYEEAKSVADEMIGKS